MKCKKHKKKWVELWPGIWECEQCFSEAFSEQYTIPGQCPSGKNAIIVLRNGRRVPGKKFSEWKKWAANYIKPMGPPATKPIDIRIKYYAGDARRRDITGIEDALWHLLENCKVVADDTFLGGAGKKALFENQGIDRDNPRVEILIWRRSAKT